MAPQQVTRGGARMGKTILALGLIVVVAGITAIPPEHIPLPSCLFREITGRPCLTCGLTRSLHAASHGELLDSLRHHLLGPLFLVAMMVVALTFLVEGWRGRPLCAGWFPGAGKILASVLAVVWVLYAVMRAITFP